MHIRLQNWVMYSYTHRHYFRRAASKREHGGGDVRARGPLDQLNEQYLNPRNLNTPLPFLEFAQDLVEIYPSPPLPYSTLIPSLPPR